MIRIGILGIEGRMGRLIADEVNASTFCALAGGLTDRVKTEFKKSEDALVTTGAEEVIALSDVVIDFTSAEATAGFARIAADMGKPFVSGTTGLSAATHDVLVAMSARIPLLYAANMSLSLTAMKQVTEVAAKLLAAFDYDVAILDEHHRMKKDAPSGTAITLGEAVLRGSNGRQQPAFTAVRAGSIIGEHEVVFAGHGETIRLHHSVTDRRIFARGAVQAALWLHGKKPGLYGMEDVLGIPTA
ncbi:MAG: 4-hydroxy-tetrahydrodipicolinate reductase [Pseudomonadota bacterium]|nr:4-hydroxy-tetrahydrodipicolinate reductase [Pseudomonadota bacterium]